jgi:hypothetical protein
MQTHETAGVLAVARMLAHTGEAPGRTVTELAAELGIRRSTAFSVAGALDATGLVQRDARGRLYPGPGAGRLFLARYGFGDIVGRAEALLSVLRDDTDSSVSLVISDGNTAFVAASRRAPWDGAGSAAPHLIEAQVCGSTSGFSATLRLALRPKTTEAEIRAASACLDRVVAALARREA